MACLVTDFLPIRLISRKTFPQCFFFVWPVSFVILRWHLSSPSHSWAPASPRSSSGSRTSVHQTIKAVLLLKFHLPVKIMVHFYTAIIESNLASSITVWFTVATARDKVKLQHIIHSKEKKSCTSLFIFLFYYVYISNLFIWLLFWLFTFMFMPDTMTNS